MLVCGQQHGAVRIGVILVIRLDEAVVRELVGVACVEKILEVRTSTCSFCSRFTTSSEELVAS